VGPLYAPISSPEVGPLSLPISTPVSAAARPTSTQSKGAGDQY